MEHSFDIDIAKEYGITGAILLKHIYYWVEKNRANDKHYINGCYWTYCSIKAFGELFPYMSAKVIRNSLTKLEEAGLIKVDCFNGQNYDRTKWYTITQKGKTLCRKGETPLSERANTFIQKGKPIPYINTDTKTVLSNDNTNNIIATSEIVDAWNSQLSELGVSKLTKLVPNSPRWKELKQRLAEYGDDSFQQVLDRIKESDFLLGKVQNRDGRAPFKVTFEWAVKPTHYVNILEGKYNREQSKPNFAPKKPTNGRQG